MAFSSLGIDTGLFQFLLKEPVYKTILDVSSGAISGLTAALPKTKTIDLRRLVHLAGPNLSDDQAVGQVLSLHYSRLADKLLRVWRDWLERRDSYCSLNQGHSRTLEHFPATHISPQVCAWTNNLGDGTTHWSLSFPSHHCKKEVEIYSVGFCI